MSTATYTATNHQLKVAAFAGQCAEYADVKRLKDNNLEGPCASRLGPVQPGINFPDPTGSAPARAAQTRAMRKRADNNGSPTPPDPAPSAPGASNGNAPAPDTTPSVPSLPAHPTVPDVPGATGGGTKSSPTAPVLPKLPTLSAKTSSADPQSQTRLLDYLLSR